MSPITRKHAFRHRSLRFEVFEDRRMLAGNTMADVVFLVDESYSDALSSTHAWLANHLVPQLESTLTDMDHDIDIRYGLIGFGETDDKGTPTDYNDDELRYAHTQLLDGSQFSASQSDLSYAMDNNLKQYGGDEDGWDAIEHAIVEYDFRPGAVPVLVLVQNDEGRIDLNETLRDEGVLAALESKDASILAPLSSFTPYVLAA